MCRDLGLDLRLMRKRPVPARLQFARDQPIGWIGSIVLPEGAVGGVARRFEVAAEGLPHLIPPLARLLLGGCGGGDRAGTDHSQQRILDGVVNTQTAEGDAVRGTIVHPGPAAAVARDAVLGACVLQRQLAPAAAAADQPGEERVAMLGRAVMPAGGNVAADHFADRFRPLPAYVSFMRIRHQRQPISPRLATHEGYVSWERA